MLFRQLFDHETSTYTYLLADSKSREAVLIDPVLDQVERDLKLIAEHGLTLRYAIDTHVHADHVTALGTLRERTGCKTVLSIGADVGCCDLKVRDGDVIAFGEHQLHVLSTPGHTDSCMSLYGDGRVYTGDALLIRSCGRTDFQQGSAPTLYRSVREKIFSLPVDTVVYPAHDYKGHTSSSVGEELNFNPRLGAGKSEAEFVAIMSNLALAYPTKIAEALPRNMQCGLAKNEEQAIVVPARSWAPIELTNEGIPEVTVEWVAANAKNVKLVDVRESDEVRGELGAIAGSLLVPLDTLRSGLIGVSKSDPVVLICRSGNRSGKAATLATALGFERVASMRGGMLAWNQHARGR